MKVGNIRAYILDDADQFLVVGKCNIPVMSGFIRDDCNGNDIETKFFIKFDFTITCNIFMNIASSCKYCKTFVAKIGTLNLMKLLVLIIFEKSTDKMTSFFPRVFFKYFSSEY